MLSVLINCWVIFYFFNVRIFFRSDRDLSIVPNLKLTYFHFHSVWCYTAANKAILSLHFNHLFLI